MTKHTGAASNLQAQDDNATGADRNNSAFTREFHTQLRIGTPAEWAQARAWRAQSKATARDGAPDESRLKGKLSFDRRSDRQRRGGEFSDLLSTHEAVERVGKLYEEASTEAQRRRIAEAIDLLPGKAQRNVGLRRARQRQLKIIRAALRQIVSDCGADKYAFLASQYADVLMKIETELAYLGGTERGIMHFDNVQSMLPLHVERVGCEAIADRFKALFSRYCDEYRDAALASIDTGEFKLPQLVTGREIGVRFNLTADRLHRLFPKGGHGIRASDRDAINAAREAKGLKVRKPAKRKTKDDIKRLAWEQRELEELMEHYGYARETILKWKSSKPALGSDLWGERYNEMLERMENEKAAGIDPKKADDIVLTPVLVRALCEFYGVEPPAVRQWKRRGKLLSKVAEYHASCALTLA